jgi:hypothetical protein
VIIKEIGLQLNVDKTNTMVLSGEPNTGRSRSMEADYFLRNIGRVEIFLNTFNKTNLC